MGIWILKFLIPDSNWISNKNLPCFWLIKHNIFILPSAQKVQFHCYFTYILNRIFYFLQQGNLNLNGLEIESFYFHRRIISPGKWIGELEFRKECLRTQDGFSPALRLNHEFYLGIKAQSGRSSPISDSKNALKSRCLDQVVHARHVQAVQARPVCKIV